MSLTAPVRVLNVNDDDGIRRHKSALLEAAGFDVIEADRVSVARRRISDDHPDVILLDVNLPDGNGVDLCRELQPPADNPDAFEGDRPFAIALISAHVTQPEDIARGMAAGADAYLVEPLDDTYLVGLLRALADRHARRRAAALERAALRARDVRYAILAATVGDAVYEWNLATDRVEWSDALYRILRDAAAGATAQWRIDRIHPDDRERVLNDLRRALAERETTLEIEYRFARGDGSHAIVVDRATIVYGEDGTPERAIGVMTDVTERRQLADQLRLAQKMEAVGLLAGGICHDFNNVLTSVMGFTGLIKHEVPDRPSVLSHADEIETAAQRASEMVGQLLAFSRRQETSPEILDVTEVVDASAGMLNRLIGANIQVDWRLDPALPTIRGDRTQIEQVLLNLVVNARDAMPNGGRLVVATDVVDIPRNARERKTMARGRYVRLSVADSGVGMDEQTRARIFEPFFTTKERGKGTGLGLATVYGIVRQSGGHVWVTSTPGAGATFDIFFPALALPATAARRPEPSEEHGALPGETILVVEDEASVRRLAFQVLSGAGYEVIDAADGLDAQALAQEPGRRIDLLVTDLVLPSVSGAVLAQVFRSAHPSGGVLFMTGYRRDGDALGPEGVPHGVLLMKPFSRDALLRGVREAISRGAGAPPAQAV